MSEPMPALLDHRAASLEEIGTSWPTGTGEPQVAPCITFWLHDFPEVHADPEVRRWIHSQPHPLAGADVVVWYDQGEGSHDPFCYDPPVRRQEGCAPERLWSLIGLICERQHVHAAYLIIKEEA